MSTTKPLLTALLALSLTGIALGQTTPTTPGSQPASGSSTQSTDANRVGRTPDGASIGNNRDRLSPGSGTPATNSRSMKKAEGQSTKAKSSTHKDKDKMKSKPMR